MKLQLKTIIASTTSIVLLSACGGGGSDPVIDDTLTAPVIDDTPDAVTKIVLCSTDTMTSLTKDDVITALEDTTEVKVIHAEDGTKEACVVSGDAELN